MDNQTPITFHHMKNEHAVTAGDRLRKLNDDGLAAVIADFVIGVVDNILLDTEYTINHNRDKYISVLLHQLQLPTTELPRQYTPDELKSMVGDKIFIQHIGACKDFYQDTYAPYYGEQEVYIDMDMGQLTACKLPLDFYGKTWVAYAYRPLAIDINKPSQSPNLNNESIESLVNILANINAKLSECQLSSEQFQKLTYRKMDVITGITMRLKAVNQRFTTAELQELKQDVENQLQNNNLAESQINALSSLKYIIDNELTARFKNDPL